MDTCGQAILPVLPHRNQPMTDILLYAASLPALVVHFVAGATAGGIGGLIGYFAGKQFGYEEIWRFTPIVFVVISFNLVTMWLERASGSVKAVNELKHRLFNLILKQHPEAERETLSRFEQIYSGPREQVSALSRVLGADIANRYVDLHTPTASDTVIHHVLQAQADIMESLKGNPTVCVAQTSARRLPASNPSRNLCLRNCLKARSPCRRRRRKTQASTRSSAP